MLNKLKKFFTSSPNSQLNDSETTKKKVNKKTAKELATEKGEPYVNVVQAFVNPNDPKNGYFEIDWNEYFIALLKENGYTGNNDEAIIDQWFKNLCRNMLEEDIQELNYPNKTKRTVY